MDDDLGIFIVFRISLIFCNEIIIFQLARVMFIFLCLKQSKIKLKKLLPLHAGVRREPSCFWRTSPSSGH